MANDFTYTQLATIIKDVSEQATGVKQRTPVNTAEFITVAQTALKCGFDPVLNAISVVMLRTIFSRRPYTAKFLSMQVDRQKFGAITRKLKIADRDWEKDQRFDLEDGSFVNQQIIRKPSIKQFNFYGQNVYQRHYTLFKDQLDLAFTGPDQFGQFVSMIVGNCSDIIEQTKETLARYIVNNYIAGIYLSRPDSCIHLLTEYNKDTGLALTRSEIMQPANFKAFVQWAYAFISSISDLLTERTSLYQTNLTDFPKMNQHTPKSKQKLYVYSPFMYQIQTGAMSNTFHNNLLNLMAHEMVNFWQSPTGDRDSLEIAPIYMDNTGNLVEGAATQINNVFGILFDYEGMGYTSINEWNAPAPFNAAGGYSNFYFHFTTRYWNDFTEKAVLFMLD